MGVELHHEPAGPVYEDILRQIAHTKAHGTTRQRFTVDTWEPAVHAHGPGGPLIGDPCKRCGKPWPCRFLLNLLDSDLVTEHGHLS
ncbi:MULTISPECIES: hypothetical protein [Sinomonas]